MFACSLLCRPLPFRQQTCLPGGPRRGPQNRPFWSPGKHVRLFLALSPIALSTANLPARSPQEEVLRIVRFGPTGTTEPQKTSQDPLGRAQELPNSPRGSPRSTPGTPEDHPRPPRHRSRAPKEPLWTPRTKGKSLFLPFLLPPPSSLPSLCNFFANHFWPTSLCTNPGDPYRGPAAPGASLFCLIRPYLIRSVR